jgi:hypothetical protein
VDTTPFLNAYVLIRNMQTHLDPDQCTVTDWALTVTGGGGHRAALPLDEVYSAAHFIPPQ